MQGQRIADRYAIGRPIARGSMGVVYEAIQEPLGRKVAVKVLDIRAGDTSATAANRHRERFLREASLLSGLSHPNTVRVFDFGVHDGLTYLVMEFVDGPTLREILRGGPMDPLRAVRITRQICGSLDEAHERGKVHRDLKPANVMIARDQDGEDLVKVVDFGLVKEMEDAVHMTGDNMMVGTPMYMAPEQIRGRKVDQRCDIYALGVVLFHAITGGFPFDEGQPAAVLMAHLTDPPRALRQVAPAVDVPACLEWTVARCLEKEPDQRFVNVRELQRALKLCEAALLDDTTAELAQLSIDRGRLVLPEAIYGRTPVPPSTRTRALGMLRGAGIAMLVLGCLVGAGILGFGGYWWLARPVAPPPAPTIADVVPSTPPVPAIEVPSPAPPVAPEPVPVAPVPAAPAPAPEPAPVAPTAPPRPAPVRARDPVPRTAPRPAPAPVPVPVEPAPAAPAPAAPAVGTSDLKDPWSH
ncbi:MAG: serine/threonine protein kinase [Alphaproteobacteria bacterium]|nr:serine/threonine protein kinase [Alphaproteobacteria bacterium]